MATASIRRPAPAQMLLLRAAFAPAEEAVTAWGEWRRTVDFEDAGPQQYELLPLVARNLPADVIEEEVAGRIAGLRRLCWSRNQLLFHAAGEAVSALAAAGIDTAVIKGAAVAPLAYGDLGVRTMYDVDLLVPGARALAALTVLAEAGWGSPFAEPAARVRVHHSVELGRPGSGEIDLHWQSLWLAADDGPLWDAAVPFEIGGQPTQAPAPEDSLLITCVHGLPWAEAAPVRWIADAVALIRAAEPAVDWDRLRAEARRRRLSAWMALPLRFLREELGVEEIPAEVVSALEADPASRAERAGLAAALRPDSPLRTYRMARDRHRRLVAMGAPETPPGFLEFARDFWGVERTAELPLHAARRLRRAARVRLSSGRGSARSAS